MARRIATERETCALWTLIAFQATDLFPALESRYYATTQSHGFSRRLIRRAEVVLNAAAYQL